MGGAQEGASPPPLGTWAFDFGVCRTQTPGFQWKTGFCLKDADSPSGSLGLFIERRPSSRNCIVALPDDFWSGGCLECPTRLSPFHPKAPKGLAQHWFGYLQVSYLCQLEVLLVCLKVMPSSLLKWGK